MKNEIQCKVTKSTTVLIRATNDSVNLEEPLFAVNWFSTKIGWLYNFYNFLAARSVLKIGGSAFFKGKITKTVLDENKVKRTMVLIIRYPNGASFKALMENTYFKLVSVFRIASVKDFTFGFTHKYSSENSSKVADNFTYVIHHFKYANTDASLFSKFQEVLGDGVGIKYAGGMVAQLMMQKEDGTPKAVPNLIDGLVIFEANKQTELEEMLASPSYKTLIESLDSSYIGYLNRVL